MTTYSHDGIRDALTHLAAPPLLYEELQRAIARTARVNEEVSLVRFVLAPRDSGNEGVGIPTFSSYQEIIVNFAHCLARLSRDEDLCARMGEREFICLLHGQVDAVSRYVARIAADWEEVNTRRTGPVDREVWRLKVASLVSDRNEKALDFLNRLDRETLVACN